MMPACKLSANITYNTCKNQGHISSACHSGTTRAIQGDNSLPHIPNAIDYFPAAASSQYVGASYTASAHNQPTPELPL